MAMASSKVGGESVRLQDLVESIDTWISGDGADRKVLARRSERGILKREERLVMQAARMLQDHGQISIITTRKNGVISFIAEKVK